MCIGSSKNSGTTVAVLVIVGSMPSSKIRLPAQRRQDGDKHNYCIQLCAEVALTTLHRMLESAETLKCRGGHLTLTVQLSFSKQDTLVVMFVSLSSALLGPIPL